MVPPRQGCQAPSKDMIQVIDYKAGNLTSVVKALKLWRLERANTQRVPAYMICPDRTLEHLARSRPETLDALASIYGLGESKIKNFGEDLLQALRDASV